MESSKKKSLSVDVGIITSLGRNSIKDPTTAILELVKNSYDAGATIVEVDIMSHLDDPFIRIADNGCGMTERDIDKNWLRIGYSDKGKKKYYRGRRKTGEKGIGRLSADRLGSILEVRSRTPKNGDISIIIDWNSFNQMGKNVEDIQFDFYDKNVEIAIPRVEVHSLEPTTGTELIIKGLRQEWIENDFDDLYKQLSMFISPVSTNSDFIIRLNLYQSDKREQVNRSLFGDFYEVKLDGVINLDAREFSYTIWGRKPGSSKRVRKNNQRIKINQLLTSSADDEPILENPLGLVKIVLLYYPRNEKTIRDSGFKLSELKDYLKENAGVKIYRDNIRVKPYGELDQPGGDWLNLGSRFAQNPAGRGRAGSRIRPNQLVGAVFISRDNNPELADSASREGLIQGDSFRLLKECVLGCLRLVEAKARDIFIAEEKLSLENNSRINNNPNNHLISVRGDLIEVSTQMSRVNDREIQLLGDTVSAIVTKIDYVTESIEELESQTRLLRGLATVGIASAVFGHETQIQISRMVSALKIAKGYLLKTPLNLSKSISNIDTASEASAKVLAWGGFALDRIRRDKREKTIENISQIIINIVYELKRAFDAVDINIDDINIDQTIESRVFQIDIEGIILNLLTNAYTACKQVTSNRKVRVCLVKAIKGRRKGYSLIVSDSGPGVNEKLRGIIWEPTFTTKTVKKGASEEGTGMGLAIIDGIVEEMNGFREVGEDLDLGGAKFEIWLPIIP